MNEDRTDAINPDTITMPVASADLSLFQQLLPTRPEELSAGQKFEMAQKGRDLGFSWAAIADALGYENGKAAERASRTQMGNAAIEIDEWARAEGFRRVLARLDMIVLRQMPAMLAGDSKAAETIMKADDRLAKLLKFGQDDSEDGGKTVVLSIDPKQTLRAMELINEGVDAQEAVLIAQREAEAAALARRAALLPPAKEQP